MGVKAELVKLIVDKTMSTLSEDTRKQAADFLFQHLYIRNEKEWQNKLDSITGGGYDYLVLCHKIFTQNSLLEMKDIGFSFYQWLGGVCTAKGHNQMDGKICRIDEDDTYYIRGPKKTLSKKERLKDMPKGSPVDCDECCNCSVVCFDPEIHW